MPSTDPFLLDADQLRSLCSDAIVRRGIAYFREHRVTELGTDGNVLRATVQGSRPDDPYEVAVTAGRDGELEVSCTCPFDWEPACKHAVAALLAHGGRQPAGEHDLQGAADEAVEERAKRGRGEVAVAHVSGDPWFGTWEAWSLDPRTGAGPRYRVEVRSLGERINHCSCPDLATNRLGTCKHVEAVIHRLRKRDRAKFDRLAVRGPPVAVVHLAWDVPLAPRVRLFRPRGLDRALAAKLDRHFDGEGFLTGPLPGAFHRLEEDLGPDDGVCVGADVREHARRVAEEAAGQARAARIKDEVARFGSQVPGVSARLYPYQVDGVAFLAANGRALLADDMGLGKTLQAIAAAHWLMDRGEVRRCVVVCPASLKHQWQREIRRFTGRDAVVIGGPASARGALYRRGEAFTILNYELLMRDGAVVQEMLSPDLLVLDEAQRIKNWRTRGAAAVKALHTTYAFVLSGTPLENRLEDLYSLMQVVDPRVLGPLWRYLLEFHVTDPRGRVLGYRNLSELRRRLAPALLRRDRRLVRDQLPDRIDLRLDVPLDPRQRGLHDDAMQQAGRLAEIASRRPLTPAEEDKLMRLLQKARMACDAAGLVDGESKGSPKLDELERVLEELCVDGGRKVVVFSQWERMTAMAEEVARGLGLGTARLHGGVPSARRGALIDRFLEDPAVQVFLSTDAGGVGLNLQAASAVVNLDEPWNPAVLEQRIARVHRLGQTESVQVVRMVAADSYEVRVSELSRSKRALFDQAVDPEGTEDAVGVSRRLVEAALASLEEARGADPTGDARSREETPGSVPEAVPADEPEPAPAPMAASAALPEDESLAPVVEAIARHFGARLDRVLAAGGGLVAVVDEVRPGDHDVAERAGANRICVAVIETRAALALARMGTASPLAGAREVSPQAPPSDPEVPPVLALARRKLRAAEAVLEGGPGEAVAEALDLLASAMIAAGAARGGLDRPPLQAEVPVWLFAEAVPRGWLSDDDAAQVLRAMALARAPVVPMALARDLLAQARRIVAMAPAPQPPVSAVAWEQAAEAR